MDLDDYRWLIGEGGRACLQELAEVDAPSVALVARLRKELSAARTHLLLEQAALRKRAERKFGTAANRLFFTPRGLEQATDPIVAGYKASRFPVRQLVADLCCGIGGDLMGLAGRGPVLGVDRDPISALLAEANLRAWLELQMALATTSLTVQVADVEQVDLSACAAWHLDPDRRPRGHRTTRVELHEPGPETIERLRVVCPHAGIKLAPAAILPDGWAQQAELEWISRGGECRQLVAWFAGLTGRPGMRRATMVKGEGGRIKDEGAEKLFKGGPQHSVLRTIVGSAGELVEIAGVVGRYVYEPDAAVLAADLCGALAAQNRLRSIEPGIAYLTGDELADDPALDAFEVLDALPFQPKRLRAFLAERGVGRLEVKQRGTRHDANLLQRELAGAGDEAATLIVTRIGGKTVALVTRRVIPPGG